MLIAEHIGKSYGKARVLDDISLRLAPGTITTLIGPSGSGKSTLLRAVSLIEPPDTGTIQMNGTTYRLPDAQPPFQPCPWPTLTVVFQQLFLWPHLTLRQNISLPLRDRPEADSETEQIITELGMAGFIDRYPNEVSLGQRQLAAITRAVALKPKYLLLDEITSSLDVEYVGVILRLLKRFREQGIALLIITHFISFARQSADQVLFMDSGRFVETGEPGILSQPQTKRLADFLSLVREAA